MKAIFIGKDGTLIRDVPYSVSPELVQLTERAGEALQLLRRLGYRLFVVSNQPGIAKGLFRATALRAVERRINDLLAEHHVRLDGFYICPHHPQGRLPSYAIECSCRKPMPGMLLRVACEHAIDLSQSWMIGDVLHDVEAGRRAGCRSILIDNGNETEWKLSPLRLPHFRVSDLHAAAVTIAILDSIEEHAQMETAR